MKKIKPIEPPLAVAQVMRARREALGFSQDSFADEIGMHRAYYGSIERGMRNMTLRTMLLVCTGLDIKLSTVLKKAGL